MCAIEFRDRLAFRRDYPEPAATADQAIVQVTRASICRTDLEIVKGYMNFQGVLGHEFVGRVCKGPKAWMDKRVVAEINCICGHCDMCTGGLRNHCRNRTVLGIAGRDGAFADKIVVPIWNLHAVPDSISDDQAVMVEPLAAAFQLVHQMRFDPQHKVIVLGDGRLGQLVARVLVRCCPRLVLVGKHEEKLALADRVHIQTVHLKDFQPRHQADIVVEATGSPAGLELAAETVRPRGTIALKSTYAGRQPLALAQIVINEVTVIGSRCGPFPDALVALARGEVDVTNLLGPHMPLEKAQEAFEMAQRHDVVKVIFDVA